ncbi:MAG TPA: sugar transferase [Ardenticatenaceae bacterium]|jgi:lipopolysaccharide/colanic/teichoic acid biosynthesis glycosyltransferase
MYRAFGKRLLDLLLAVLVLFLLSPVLLVVALLVRLRLGSPVLFRQPRAGLNEEYFTVIKFRTMTDERDAEGKLLPDEKRLTPFGIFLRKSSLDEFPELINVLKGEMSLVGPRPLITKYVPYYTEAERVRHSVRPGITGWAQVKGRNALRWDDRLALDVWYVQNLSLLLDLKILWLTIASVLRHEGVEVNPRGVMLDLDEERRGTRSEV